MRFISVALFVPSVIITAMPPDMADIEITAPIATAIESTNPTATASDIEKPSPLVSYLGKVPGQEFAKRQIEFFKVSFESVVTGSTGAEADRISQALEELFRTMITEGANERDFYVLGGIINKFIREANPYLSRSNAIRALIIKIYLELGRNILGIGKRVLEDLDEQDLISRAIMALDMETDPLFIPTEITQGYVECLEALKAAQTRVEDLVGGDRDTRLILVQGSRIHKVMPKLEQNIKLFANEIPGPIIEWFRLVNSRDAHNVYSNDRQITQIIDTGSELTEMAIQICIYFRQNLHIIDLMGHVLSEFTTLTRIAIKETFSRLVGSQRRESEISKKAC